MTTSGEHAIPAPAGARGAEPLALLVGWPGLVAAAAGVAAGLARFGASDEGLVCAWVLGSLGLLAWVDLRHETIPNLLVLPAAAVALALQLALFPDDAVEWLVAAGGCFLALLAVALVRRGGIGVGDVKLGLLLGAGLGSEVVTAVLIGFLALWPVAAWIVLRDGSGGRTQTLPLTPALALGAALVLLSG